MSSVKIGRGSNPNGIAFYLWYDRKLKDKVSKALRSFLAFLRKAKKDKEIEGFSNSTEKADDFLNRYSGRRLTENDPNQLLTVIRVDRIHGEGDICERAEPFDLFFTEKTQPAIEGI